MFDARTWLEGQLRDQAVRAMGAPEACETLHDRLDTHGLTFHFEVHRPPWVSSRFEEGEVDLKWNDGRIEQVRVVITPMRLGKSGRKAVAA